MFKRMQMFVNGLGEQTGRHGMKCELILVEWNPPPDRPPLAEALSFEKTKNRMPVRIITVPNEIHRKWIHWDEIPLFQMIGKNVGIRRAKTDFILCTNVDLLFSDELCEFLAKGEFDENAMYRANRCDVPMEVLDIVGLEEQLKFCKTHVIRRLGQFPWGYGKPFAFLRRIKKKIAEVAKGRKHPMEYVDTEACGDFTMMHRRAWEHIGGYVELGLYSIHIDTLACHSAVACGYKQIVLPPQMCTYHADHGHGWMSMCPVEKIKFIERRPALDWTMEWDAAKWMYENKKPLNINSEHWGHSDVMLIEKSIN